MERPTTQDPTEWARYNEWRNTMCRMFVGNMYRELATTQIATGVDVRTLPTPVLKLVLAMRRAASELENGGERENRIAQQLLGELAEFAKETGT